MDYNFHETVIVNSESYLGYMRNNQPEFQQHDHGMVPRARGLQEMHRRSKQSSVFITKN